ncbi:MAG: hypothetical protein KDD28_00455, partial [Phaeodactylibacter sp.]|nr:hypothetical protein [Phaeodactylibacter sp.]
AGSLGFTYCQVPILYKLSEKRGIAIFAGDGAARQLEGLEMEAADSARIFGRSGEIARIEVQLQPGLE